MARQDGENGEWTPFLLLRGPRHHLLQPQRLAPRPQRLLSLQRAHGAAPVAYHAGAATSDCGNARLDAAAAAEEPDRCPRRARDHETQCLLRDVQYRFGGLA